MTGDTIGEYLGKMVRVETGESTKRRPAYIGRVSNYDSDFVTLNPYMHRPDYVQGEAKDAFKTLGRFMAGTTNKQITIGRRTILTIEEIMEPRE